MDEGWSTFRCVDCDLESPPVREGGATLSTQHGWRLHRGVVPSGEVVFAWRCAACWQKYKMGRVSGAYEATPRPADEPAKEDTGRYAVVFGREGRGPRGR